MAERRFVIVEDERCLKLYRIKDSPQGVIEGLKLFTEIGGNAMKIIFKPLPPVLLNFYKDLTKEDPL